MKDKNGNHICVYSGCCEYTEPSTLAMNVIEAAGNLHPYEWFKAEAGQETRRATRIAAVVLIALYLIAFAVFS